MHYIICNYKHSQFDMMAVLFNYSIARLKIVHYSYLNLPLVAATDSYNLLPCALFVYSDNITASFF